MWSRFHKLTRPFVSLSSGDNEKECAPVGGGVEVCVGLWHYKQNSGYTSRQQQREEECCRSWEASVNSRVYRKMRWGSRRAHVFFIIWKDAQYTRTQREIRRKRVISLAAVALVSSAPTLILKRQADHSRMITGKLLFSSFSSWCAFFLLWK